MQTVWTIEAKWSPWSEWKKFDHVVAGPYRARHRTLDVGKVRLCVLCETGLRPKAPFFFYLPAQRPAKERRNFATLTGALACITEELS